jgi:hypothetical protein
MTYANEARAVLEDGDEALHKMIGTWAREERETWLAPSRTSADRVTVLAETATDMRSARISTKNRDSLEA